MLLRSWSSSTESIDWRLIYRDALVRGITIDARYCGPPDSGNGGYVAGRLAHHLHVEHPHAVEVTLRAPAPLDRRLAVQLDDVAMTATLLDGDVVVAEARVLPELAVDVPEPVDVETATRVAHDSPMLRDADAHPFPTCFVCGPARAPGDGLRLFPGQVPGRDVFAAVYTADAQHVADEFTWAALDCPSSFPMYLAEDPFDGPVVLGRFAVRVEEHPPVGVPMVVLAWREGVDGRKLHTASALVHADGRVAAVARATWIQLRQSS